MNPNKMNKKVLNKLKKLKINQKINNFNRAIIVYKKNKLSSTIIKKNNI
jgi:hypothetical protein